GAFRNGRAYVVYGSADIPDSPIALESLVSERLAFVVDGSDDYEMLGETVSIIGDINADGYADLAVGGPDAEIGTTGTGRCYIVLGTANVPATPVNVATIQNGTHPGIIIESQQERSNLCWAINTRPGD